MSLLQLESRPPLPRALAGSVNLRALRAALEGETTAEVRFDDVSRALYSTDASVYRIAPLGVALPRTTARSDRHRSDLRPPQVPADDARRRHLAERPDDW